MYNLSFFNINKKLMYERKRTLIIFMILTITIILIYNINLRSQTDSLFDALKNKKGKDKIEVYKELVNYYLRIDPDAAVKYGEEGLNYSLEIKDRVSERDLNYLLGISYHSQSNYDKAFHYYQLSFEQSSELGDSVQIGESLNRIALIYNVKGNYETALDYAIKSIRILENQNDKNALAKSYNHLGILYYVLKDYNKAEEVSTKALSFSESLEDDLIIAASHEHLVIIYIKLKQFEKALYHVRKTLELRKKNNDKLGMAGSYENMAIIYRNLKDYKTAIEHYDKSLAIKKELKNRRGMSSTYFGVGKLYLEIGEYNKSIYYTKLANDIRMELGDKRGLVSSLNQLSEIYTFLNDHKKALEFYKLSKIYADSLLSEQKNEAIAQLSEKYDSESREKEILLLQKENTIQKNMQLYLLIIIVLLLSMIIIGYFAYRSKKKMTIALSESNRQINLQKEELESINSKLEELLVTKDKFFSIIAHDLKSPFQGFLGILGLVDEDIKKIDDKEIQEYIILLKESAESTYQLLENLLEWSYIQRNKLVFQPVKIELRKLVEDILKHYIVFAKNKNIRLFSKLEEDFILNADKNMLETILRNLISNAIKFSRENGKVEITAKLSGNTIEINVIDNGIGIPQEFIPKLFSLTEKVSRKGTGGEKSSGLGLLLCKEYVEKHNGNIRVDSTEEKGSQFIISIPVTT